MREIIGPRFVSVDLDCAIIDRMEPVWDRPEDFVIWESRIKAMQYNGSMWMMDAGSRAQVYDKFIPTESPRLARRAGYLGSDQAWINYVLGGNEAVWTRKDGVYNFRLDLRHMNWALPADARIVFFCGNVDPWSQFAQDHAPWVLEHYR